MVDVESYKVEDWCLCDCDELFAMRCGLNFLGLLASVDYPSTADRRVPSLLSLDPMGRFAIEMVLAQPNGLLGWCSVYR
jgi:hypothetical protein